MRSDQVRLGGPLYPIRPAGSASTQAAAATSGVSFKETLDKALQGQGELKFSAHATERMSRRNLQLSEHDMARLQQAADKAAAKGAHDSLILMKNMGFIVSIDNRTVLTAVNTDELKDQVFTNIDSTVLANE